MYVDDDCEKFVTIFFFRSKKKKMCRTHLPHAQHRGILQPLTKQAGAAPNMPCTESVLNRLDSSKGT